MEKDKKRLADIFIAFDKEDIVQNLKLTGLSALQYLIKESDDFTKKLYFNYDSKEDVKVVSELRKELSKQLPRILMKQSFSIDTKLTTFGPSFDNYVIKDLNSSLQFEIYIDYLNRCHILKPEFFARKDEDFKDIHLNSLNMSENYAIYIVDYLFNKASNKCLKTIIDENKIIKQQIPFIKKMVTFYMSYVENITIDQTLLFNDLLKEVTSFNDQEINYLNHFKQGQYLPEMILPASMALNVKNHPKALLLQKKLKV